MKPEVVTVTVSVIEKDRVRYIHAAELEAALRKLRHFAAADVVEELRTRPMGRDW